MTSPSPSEFLTFMKHITVRSSLRPSTISLASRQPFVSTAAMSSRRLSTSPYSLNPSSQASVSTSRNAEHVTNKRNRLDVQSAASQSGKEGKAKGGVDTATSQVDDTSSSKKAKTDHPEAPKPVIGMQDERGRKGY